MTATREDIESILSQLLHDFSDRGVDFVLGIRYSGSKGQSGYVLKNTGDPVICRRLSRMIWASLQEEKQPTKVVDEDDS